jgi:hypothetical protein
METELQNSGLWVAPRSVKLYGERFATRRGFLELAGLAAAGCLSGCVGRGSPRLWTRWDVNSLKSSVERGGSLGWAAWQEGRLVVSSNLFQRGTAYSITKSLATLAATKAAADGWLSPSERVADTIYEWRGDPLKSRITVLMLLQQVSGLESGDIPLYRHQPADKGKAAVALRCVNSPESVFCYGPSHWELLAEIMRRKLAARKENLADFIAKAVMDRIGLNAEHWRSDKQRIPYFSTGAELSAFELGRLASTISTLLSGKNVTGFSASHFAQLTKSSVLNPMFGGGLWKNSNAKRPGAMSIEVEKHLAHPYPASFWSRACLSTTQPADFVALIGSSGRRVYIWPGADKYLARLGPTPDWRDVPFLEIVKTN